MLKVEQILEERRRENDRLQEERIEEVYQKVPRISEIDKEIRQLNMDMIQRGIKGSDILEIEVKINKIYKEKEDLLISNGFTIDYMEKKYQCNICHDTGINGTKICNCKRHLMIEESYKNSTIENIIKVENFDNFNLNLFRKSIMDDEEISPYENMKALRDELKEYAKHFGRDSLNLYIYGPVGTGKTYLLNCIAKEIMDNGLSVVYLSESDLVSNILEHRFAYSENKQKLRNKIDMIYDADLLIIDDLGANNTNDTSISAVFEALNKRLVNKVPVIISSNLHPEDLRIFYDQRIYSRIAGNYFLKELYGNDLRISKWN
ncbi:MAG: ATP-binding protein [Helcococcus sp.]|nr:ATP-binding protein [Helcococcus sp.]